MGFLGWTLRIVEELSLIKVLPELLRLETLLDTHDLLWVVGVTPFFRFGWWDSTMTVGPIIHLALMDHMLALAITLVVHNRANWTIYWQLLPVDAKPRKLSIKVREIATLQQWVIGEADAWHDVGCAEGHLLSLRKVLIDIPVEFKLSNVSNRHLFLRPHLGGIEDVEFKIVLLRFFEGLDTEFPLGKDAVANGFVKIHAMEVWVLSTDLESFIPYERMNAQGRGEVKFDKMSFTLVIL